MTCVQPIRHTFKNTRRTKFPEWSLLADLPDGGPIPLYRYRAFKKTRQEKQTDRIEELATKLALPRAALTGDPEVAPLVGGDQKVVSTASADPDPFQEFHFPNALAAKRAIADSLRKLAFFSGR